ncbi:Ser-Thr-rich glycosyl-phosphatidyl-inositol-anchored membrane family-domain-containing protein [Elsinoe ampelina]|uniref:Ser-Thr-rich glycosyl-phosphatidyl-inositol-anchored membrane family-domain-containing protein n=1 Tax=Elsinoe ampelina TaxID=302913 RepID=A0A6A6GH55_9PEZI|nr:Ser-Thr-rich glycosyl-phosphatidyl-inositol-anchored membrane family-domain-containing protein [Elsinoe ampelina]
MSDFSTFALFTAGLAVFAPLVAAHDKEQITVPGGSNPTAGAVFQPGLNSVVPAGSGFSVTWKPTEEGCGKKVDLVLLKGPSASAMAPYSYIAKGLNNNGSYSWTPSTSLEPSEENYGIELICQETQAYQYSTRFGISNDKYVAGSDDHSEHSSSSSAATATKSGYPVETPKYPVGTGTATGGIGYPNGTEPTPTGSITVPSSLRTSTTAPTTTSRAATTAAQSTTSGATGAAAALQTGASGLLAAAALAALAL